MQTELTGCLGNNVRQPAQTLAPNAIQSISDEPTQSSNPTGFKVPETGVDAFKPELEGPIEPAPNPWPIILLSMALVVSACFNAYMIRLAFSLHTQYRRLLSDGRHAALA